MKFSNYIEQLELEEQIDEGCFTIDEVRKRGLKYIADKLGVPISKISAMSSDEIQIVSKFVGKHDFEPNKNFDRRELKMGIEIEKEHTNNYLVAELIAKDHLAEIPDYYSRLKKMERSAS